MYVNFVFFAVMQCYRPPAIENANYEIKNKVDGVSTIGSSAVYICKEGYELNDTDISTLRCELDKKSKEVKWRGELPSCKGNLKVPSPNFFILREFVYEDQFAKDSKQISIGKRSRS